MLMLKLMLNINSSFLQLFGCHQIYLSKLVNLLLSFPSHRCTQSSLLITFSCPSLASRLKIECRSYYHSAPVLWNIITSDLRHVANHVIPSPVLNSPVSDRSTSLFLKKSKTYLFHSFFPP